MNDHAILGDSASALISGAGNTLSLAASAILGSTACATVLGLIRAYRVPVLSGVVRAYVSLFRSIPLPLLLLALFFGSAYLGLGTLGLFGYAVVAMIIYESAYIAEIVRSGIESVPTGQHEAAKVLNLSPFAKNKYVIGPQAWKLMVAPLVGHYIWLIKDTSLALIIGYGELLRSGQAAIDRGGSALAVYGLVGAVYFAICYPLSLWQRALHRRTLR